MSVDLSTPSQDEAVELGIREWPQQVKSGTWTESVDAGSSLTRYILEGRGTVTLGSGDKKSLSPGMLLTFTDESMIEWEASTADMIILTPGYEEGGKLAAVFAILVLLLGAIVAGGSM